MKHKLGGWDLEDIIKGSFDIGEGMALIDSPDGGLTILNKATGVFRQFSTSENIIVSDKEIDYEAIERMFRDKHKPNKMLFYGGVELYGKFKNGVAALAWRVGLGKTVYCIISRDLDVMVPFKPIRNLKQQLEECGSRLRYWVMHRYNSFPNYYAFQH